MTVKFFTSKMIYLSPTHHNCKGFQNPCTGDTQSCELCLRFLPHLQEDDDYVCNYPAIAFPVNLS